jgi:hypothetical protein
MRPRSVNPSAATEAITRAIQSDTVEELAARRTSVRPLIIDCRWVFNYRRREWRVERISDGFQIDSGAIDGRLFYSLERIAA